MDPLTCSGTLSWMYLSTSAVTCLSVCGESIHCCVKPVFQVESKLASARAKARAGRREGEVLGLTFPCMSVHHSPI